LCRCISIKRNARQVHAVVNHLIAIARQQANLSHAAIAVVAHANHFRKWIADNSRRAALPKRCAYMFVTFWPGVMIREKDFMRGLQPRDPRVQADEADIVQVQNLWMMFAHQPHQVQARAKVTVSGIRESHKLYVRQIQEIANLIRGFGKKAKNTLPAALMQLL